MNIEKAMYILSEYGKYMENSKIIHIGFEEDMPFSKEEVLLAVFTAIEESSSKYSLDLLFIVVMDLLKHVPKLERYNSLLQYQQALNRD